MLRKLFTLIVCLVATVATTSAQTPPDNEIWYTTTDGNKIGDQDPAPSFLISNTFSNGKGILKFSKRVIRIGDPGPVGIEDDQEREEWWKSLNYHMAQTFEGYKTLKTITIPNSVTWIYDYAFSGCKNLISINIPNSVTEIGSEAFNDCSSLTSITIPNSVTSIGDYAFNGCSSLTSVKVSNKYCYDYFKNLGVPDITFMVSTLEEYEEAQKLGATKITIDSNSRYASEDGLCLIDNGKLILFIEKDLTEYTIPESVTSIERLAFQDCSSLKSITIPNSVTSIGKGAFLGCSSLTSITIPNSVKSIEYGAFSGCSSLTSITIPDSVTSIGEAAFAICSSLKSVKGKYASSDGRCLIIDGKLIAYAPVGLTSYTIPNSVTSIEYGAFAGCGSLTSITIPNSVTSIGERAFEGCSSLTSITIPDSITIIGSGAFYGCSSLTSITIPNSVTSIGAYAFLGCSSLTSINIPNSITSIGKEVFLDCSSLTSITIPDSVTEIGDGAFYGCSSLTSITIPNSVTEIGDGAFQGCSSLISITIPNSVTSIGKGAFLGCSSLTSITIPDSVKSIGGGAFYDCSSLTSITISNGVTSIGEEAFNGCSSLKSVKVANKYCYDYFKNLGVPDITFIVSTPKEYEEAQKIGATKLAIDSNSKYASKDGLCLIDNGKLILFIGKDLTEYTIPEGVTSFRKEVFKDCSALKSVKVANKYCYDYFKDKVADIAFYGANASADGRCLIVNGELQRFIGKGITEYSIPEGVTSVGDNAFRNYNRLTSITIPDSVTSIEDEAFHGCDSLTSITCLATTPPAIGNLWIGETTMIYVPQKAVKAYKKDPEWSIFKKQIKRIK